jgi:hypothetical protein
MTKSMTDEQRKKFKNMMDCANTHKNSDKELYKKLYKEANK